MLYTYLNTIRHSGLTKTWLRGALKLRPPEARPASSYLTIAKRPNQDADELILQQTIKMVENADIILSIDLGTTFTGVAWMTPNRPIQVINDWPGSGDRGERKVPTILVYNTDWTISSWGFACADDDDHIDLSKTRREFFKIFLDYNTLAVAHENGLPGIPESTTQAQRFIIDYLKLVYGHIKETIEIQIGKQATGGWGSMSVLFLFSVPTTWTNMTIINTYKDCIREAGFGTEGPNHTAIVDLTEAEAASIATLKASPVGFQKNDLFLTVDAGGGTTDFALMRVVSTESQFPEISQVSAVTGIGVGSSLIDRAFLRLVSQRLEAYPDFQKTLPPEYPLRMSRSHFFKNLKHKFGDKTHFNQNEIKIQMDGVSFEVCHPGLRIEHGRMAFSREEIQGLFDVQVEGIMRRIREQLDWISNSGCKDQVAYMVLAGGLGSSVYVRTTIQQQLYSLQHPSAQNIVVIPTHEPQLVVIRGLLIEHEQKLQSRLYQSPDSSGRGVLVTRIARASYGVLVKVPYQPTLHANEDLERDRLDPDRVWALRQIEWVIRKGDAIDPTKLLSKSFEYWLAPNETNRSWDAVFVVSQNEARELPRSLKGVGASRLCSVKSNLSGVQQHQLVVKHKRGTCFSRGKKYYICTFDVRVIVGPADLRFELWFAGRKWSGNHEPISVQWD